MMKKKTKKNMWKKEKMVDSIFEIRKLSEIYKEIQTLYLDDDRPWVIGYSGGKDSTVILQLTWEAIAKLPVSKRKKHVYVISTDTLVESPPLVKFVTHMHKLINESAQNQRMPISAQQIYPEVEDSFWVNLLGKGYPSPQKTFRWCTSRMKIKPADKFIVDKVNEFGEVILVLGVRKDESITRAQSMELYKIKNSLLSRHSKFSNAFVYTPIEAFTTDDVWNYLLQKKNPWGADNRELLSLYTSKESGECPLVIDKTTPSCGGSRFGCWTCTVVAKDNSMINLIDDGAKWLTPLLNIRDDLYKTTDPEVKKEVREFKSKRGFVRFKTNGTGISRGPYKLSFCKDTLKKILIAQKDITDVYEEKDFKAITEPEIHEIRRIWVNERGDWEDSVPKIYKEVFGRDLDWVNNDSGSFSKEESSLIQKICSKNEIPHNLLMKLLDLERQYQGITRRSAILKKMDSIFKEEWKSEEEVLKEFAEESKDEI